MHSVNHITLLSLDQVPLLVRVYKNLDMQIVNFLIFTEKWNSAQQNSDSYQEAVFSGGLSMGLNFIELKSDTASCKQYAKATVVHVMFRILIH